MKTASATLHTLLVSWLLLVGAGGLAHVNAQDWPQWRGPNRDGSLGNFAPPKAWPAQLKSKWKITVGEGHASPLVVGARVFVHSRVGEQELVRAFDLNTGKQLWQDAYAVAYTMNSAATEHGKGPKATPVVANGKLYTLGITGVLGCYDTANGKRLWQKDFGQIFGAKAPLFGTASSPLVDRGLVIAQVGGNDQGGVIALDANTGAEKWRWTGDGPGYSSPLAVDLVGKHQYVMQSQKKIIGLWADNGGLLWEMPFDTEYVQNIVTPLPYKDTLIFSGINKGTFAVRVGYSNNNWTTTQVWLNKEVSMYMNSPALVGDTLVGLSHKNKGQYFCVDAATGKTLWTSDPRQGENAVTLTTAGLVWQLNTDGELLIWRVNNGKTLQLAQKYQVATSATWAHPAVTNGKILVKDVNSLTAWGWE